MTKKTKEALEFDHEEETSFQGRFMYVKVFVFTTVFVAFCYKLNGMMIWKL